MTKAEIDWIKAEQAKSDREHARELQQYQEAFTRAQDELEKTRRELTRAYDLIDALEEQIKHLQSGLTAEEKEYYKGE